MTKSTIFSRIRFEHEEKHYYYLPSIVSELEQRRPRVLVGNRGTGKTTLLKSLSWKERLDSQSLRAQLGADPFSGRYIGLYAKLPEIQLHSIDRWLLKSTDDQLSGGIVSCYLDSVWIQLAARAVSELISRGHFSVDPDYEEQIISEAIFDFDIFPAIDFNGSRPTLMQLRRLARSLQVRIESHARRGTDPLEVADEIPVEIGSFGRVVGAALASLCRNYRADPQDKMGEDDSWRFLICLDEAETLSRRQQIALNSMIRLSMHPVFMIASYVSTPTDIETTLFDNLTLQRADLEITRRDKLPPEELQLLLEGVANARISGALSDSVESLFSMERVLGQSDLNAMLAKLLQRSERTKSRKYIDAAENLNLSRGVEAKSDDLTLTGEVVEPLPIIEAFTLDKLPDSLSKNFLSDPRRMSSAYGRGKTRVMAYLAIHYELGSKPRYAGSEMVSHLCDSCVRDFLWQMDAMLDEIAPGRDERDSLRAMLARSPIPIDVQSRALEKASRRKIERIDESLSTVPERGRRVILGLAELTKLLTRAQAARRPLDAEPGLFRIKISTDDFSAESIVRDAIETGYMKRVRSESGDLIFRLHNSLAPAYGISWRGGYRDIRVEPEDLRRMANSEDAKIPEISKSIFARMRPSVGTPDSLFTIGGQE